jgi:deazaflavin-dependent oxidoreductase (nitroreductase family)
MPQVFLPLPNNRLMKAAVRLPLWLFRLGLGGWVGRHYLVLSSCGRKPGAVLHTALEYGRLADGRIVTAAPFGPHSDWLLNAEVDPQVTIQTDAGREYRRLRRLIDPGERAQAWAALADNPFLLTALRLVGFHPASLPGDDLPLVVLELPPTAETLANEPPPPLTADLRPLWGPLLLGSLVGAAIFLRGRQILRRALER